MPKNESKLKQQQHNSTRIPSVIHKKRFNWVKFNDKKRKEERIKIEEYKIKQSIESSIKIKLLSLPKQKDMDTTDSESEDVDITSVDSENEHSDTIHMNIDLEAAGCSTIISDDE